VPLMGGRSRRQKEPPQLDHQRDKSEPERFINWDLEALQPVKRAIQTSVKAAQKEAAETDSTAQQLKKNVDKAINILPMFAHGFYEHPPINREKEKEKQKQKGRK